MRDSNLCEHCEQYLEPTVRTCPTCRQPLVLPTNKAISVWQLDDVEDGVLGPILAGLHRRFRREVVLQPSFLREDLSDRSSLGWRGISANVFLAQVNTRQEASPRTWLSLGITEKNIVPSGDYNFLFGFAYEGAAVLSLRPLRRDSPSRAHLVERAVQIAVHELGHAMGLDHHAYEDGIECTMVGDEEVDDLDAIDQGTSRFCKACRRQAGL